MRGAEETVDLGRFRASGLQDGADGGRCEHVIAEDGEIAEPLSLGLRDGDGRRRRRGLEADGEEHDFARRIVIRGLQHILNRVDHADIGPGGSGADQRMLLRARHAHHVAIGTKDDAVRFGEFDGIVEPPDRQNADGTARPVDEMHVGRHQVLDAMAEDGMGVPAAEFHEMIVARRIGLTRDLC